jgi:molybdopterin molybdotransferase
MPEFFNVLPPEEARRLLFKHLPTHVDAETVGCEAALNRITTESINAPHALPEFRRSTMDGYAVKAADTFGASSSLPAYLTVIGEVQMGMPADYQLKTGEAVTVHTGGMIPSSADAVVQIEHTQHVTANGDTKQSFEIEVLRPAAVGLHVLQVGEDVIEGAVILPAGHRIRPQDLGGLMALGITEVRVARRPKIAIISTGDEVVPPANVPAPGQIRDINSYTIAGQIRQAGGIPVLIGIIRDNFAAIKEAAAVALGGHDMIVISAGSSVSVRDMTVRVIDELGEPGVLFHGVATRPGKPTIAGVVENKAILGLPGNPVSAMVQFMMFGLPTAYRLQGLVGQPRQGLVWARVSKNIPSESGREDYIPAKLQETDSGMTAIPVFGKSNLIYTLVNADGLMKIPLNSAGLEAGNWVEVQIF